MCEERKGRDLFGFLFLEDFYGHVVDSSVVKHYDASVRSWFDVYATVFAKFIVAAAEIVANGLNGYVEFVGDFVGRSVGQTVLQAAQLVECDCLNSDVTKKFTINFDVLYNI